MKIIGSLLLLLSMAACGRKDEAGNKIITVSIAPYKYFVEEIAGDNFSVNVMVPAGANPHIYEPFPEQISRLRKSVAYISNGYLGFEMTWLDRFYEMNRDMKRLSVAEYIDPIIAKHTDHAHHLETADPHYWVSPKCGVKMASAIRDFLIQLDPDQWTQYEQNHDRLLEKINALDRKARDLAASGKRAFMIYHPNLAYIARDYGLEEIPVEYEGKEPVPSRMASLIDLARENKLNVILVQREYDTKNAQAVADEVGAKVVIIDPLSDDWYASTEEIISILKSSFEANPN